MCGQACAAATSPTQVTTVHTLALKVQQGSPHECNILASFFFYNTRKWSYNVYLLYSNWVISYKVNYNKVQQIKTNNWDNTAAEMLTDAMTLKKKSNKF